MDLEPVHQLRDEALRLIAAVQTASDGNAPSVTGSQAGVRVTIDGQGTVSDVAVDGSWRQEAGARGLADHVLLAYQDASTSRLQHMLERIEENSARPPIEERLKAANSIPDPPRPSAAMTDQAMSRIRDLGGIRAATQDMIKALTAAGKETFESRQAEGGVVARANRQGEITYLNIDSTWAREVSDRSISQQVAAAMKGAQDLGVAAPSLDDLMWETPLGRAVGLMTERHE
ncbi:hypothetical protein OH802_03500 [Nocardioides sp. NBC_00850]|uniref:hypothetical protein n=1 Tax=Nocardioides sp. NBC_00850 TaxID=2976001 RepID=UPI00386A2070|nr:hypothetical protein OH802_03500 [Nocardioides sp. NBC_00850]